MKIRKANIHESERITTLIISAMEDIIYNFIGMNSYEKAIQFLNSLVQEKNNQYSYQNCWVLESNNEIVAAAIVYDGAKLNELRKPIASKIKIMFNKDFNPEDETEAGEYYIDCIGVNPDYQRQGIGSKVLHFLINEYVYNQNKKLGLLVDKDNPDAKKIYLRLGFEAVGERTLVGKNLEHLQFVKKTL